MIGTLPRRLFLGLIAAFTLSLVIPTSRAALITHPFRPSATDPAITQFDNFQFAYNDPALTPRNQLVLFFPGTGGAPIGTREFSKNAGSLGFHSLGLTYNNPIGINELCNTNDPTNPNCHENTRLEVIDGIDRSPLVSVDVTHSILNRTLKALQYLHATFPAQGWNQYFTGQDIEWQKIIVAGHSQGAGHAALIARDNLVARCLNFAGLDWWAGGLQIAPWLSQPFATPVDRIYVLAHQRDEKVNFLIMQAYANVIDVDRYGDFVTPEIEPDPLYRGRHFLATDVEPVLPPPDGRYHGAMITDAHTPLAADGVTPVMKPTWDFMLLSDTQRIRIEKDAANLSVIFSPGSLRQSQDLATWAIVPSADSPHILPSASAPPRAYFRLEYLLP